MHVLIVNKHMADTVGGSEAQCHGIAEQLLRMGHRVTYGVCAPVRSVYAAPYEVVPLANPLVGSFRRLLDRIRPDVVYWRYNKRHLFRCAMAAKVCRVRFVLAVSHINDVSLAAAKPPMTRDMTWSRRIVRYLRWARSLAYSAGNSLGFALLSGAVLQHRGQDTQLIRAPKRVIYNSFHAVVADDGFALPSGRIVLWVGSVKKSKNPEMYLALAEQLLALDVMFVMVGDIQDRDYAEALRQATERLPNFVYLGLQSQSRVSSLMAGCLFLVHTCSPEGFPNVFVQAWTHGKPVVSLSFDPDGLLKGQRLGFHSGSWTNFTRDVTHLIENDDARREIGDRARSFAARHFDATANVGALASFMTELIDGKPRLAS